MLSRLMSLERRFVLEDLEEADDARIVGILQHFVANAAGLRGAIARVLIHVFEVFRQALRKNPVKPDQPLASRTKR